MHPKQGMSRAYFHIYIEIFFFRLGERPGEASISPRPYCAPEFSYKKSFDTVCFIYHLAY